MIYWDFFTSLFQLIAAYCLTYALIEKFGYGLQQIIQETDKNNIDSICKEYENVGMTHSANFIRKLKYDFIHDRINSLSKIYRLVYLQGFFAAFSFIFIAGFERVYIKDNTPFQDALHAKFGGLILVPFFALFCIVVYLAILKVISKEDILKGYSSVDKEDTDLRNLMLGGQKERDFKRRKNINLIIGLSWFSAIVTILICWKNQTIPDKWIDECNSKIMVVSFVILIILLFFLQTMHVKKIYNIHSICGREGDLFIKKKNKSIEDELLKTVNNKVSSIQEKSDSGNIRFET